MIQGIPVATRAPEARKLIGYCPQFDAILDSLTVTEHLFLYGRVKGLKGQMLNQTVEQQIKELDLAAYRQARAGTLSGGNKRKLSVAMATIGEPPMVFLDEPSAGMDPVARRGMWSLIQNIAEKRKKSVVILTTHSMEEAEALCSRVAIQVDGQFRCLGTPQQIKSKYGQGLELNVRLATPNAEELEAACGKMGGSGGSVIPLEEAKQQMDSAFGQAIRQKVEGRHGSPLMELPGRGKRRGVQRLVLAEWGILQERVNNFENFLQETLGAEAGGSGCCVVLERTQNVVRYQILPVALQGKYKSLGALFSLFKDNSQKLQVDDFQICQTSLEQVFNRFAATQASQDAYGAAGYTATAAVTGGQVAPVASTPQPATEKNPNTEDNAPVKPVGIGKAQDTEH
jgi:ATP-binding cassette subfamily A (ABC1) protein 3